MVVPQGASVRTTAAPLLCCEAASVALGSSPIALRRGAYVALFRGDGFEELRIPFEVPSSNPVNATRTLHARMLVRGTSLPGFVRIDGGAETSSIWMLEREINLGDYIAFVNDPPVLRRIRASATPMLYPRDEASASKGGMWRRHRGRYRFDPAPANSPLTGISRADASAYAAWLTERFRAKGQKWRVRLPSYEELERAACVGPDRLRRFVYGVDFEPTYFKSLYARSRACLEISMSYPIDESAYGIFDLTGSVREWTSTIEKQSVKVFGGSWQHSTPPGFLNAAYSGEGIAITSTGFRLVAERTP